MSGAFRLAGASGFAQDGRKLWARSISENPGSEGESSLIGNSVAADQNGLERAGAAFYFGFFAVGAGATGVGVAAGSGRSIAINSETVTN